MLTQIDAARNKRGDTCSEPHGARAEIGADSVGVRGLDRSQRFSHRDSVHANEIWSDLQFCETCPTSTRELLIQGPMFE
jgi:hypothetical protein